jgi:ATP/maltotriose-dependent transcriptional regulator MalT
VLTGSADRTGASGADELAALGEAAWWEGDVEESLAAWEQAYRRYLRGAESDRRRGAMLAMDIGFTWYLRGEEAMGSGWLGRARRLLAGQPPCVEHGYLRTLEIDAAVAAGDYDTAIEVARAIAALADEHGDETLLAYALVSEGVATIKSGRVADGLAVLDEAMLPVVAGRVRPVFAGNIYCQLMSVCHELGDLRRAEQWTDVTARWCEGFESAVMFLGVCRLHRAQLLQIRGEWSRAEEELRRVCEDLAAMNMVAVGLALYELAEVRRLRGDLTGADEAYAEAHRHGRDPQPGLALLWLAQGRPHQALEVLLAAESNTGDRLARARLSAALVEVALAAGDLDTARRATEDLEATAATYGSSGLAAAAVHCRGLVRLAGGDAAGALDALQVALRRWQELDAPYRAACARLQLAGAHEALGNRHAAAIEREAAGAAFDRLGVTNPPPPFGRDPGARLPAGITSREAEVLRLVARGMSNREVAEELVLSEKTVARHLANLYVKLGVSSRTAAAAFAYAHGLAAPPTA